MTLKIAEIAKNANSEEAFITRFFKVFDAFWIMKYVHFARDNFHKQVSGFSCFKRVAVGIRGNQSASENGVRGID